MINALKFFADGVIGLASFASPPEFDEPRQLSLDDYGRQVSVYLRHGFAEEQRNAERTAESRQLTLFAD